MQQFFSFTEQVNAHMAFLKARGLSLNSLQFNRVIRYRPLVEDQQRLNLAYRTWINETPSGVELVTKVRDSEGNWLPESFKTSGPRGEMPEVVRRPRRPFGTKPRTSKPYVKRSSYDR